MDTNREILKVLKQRIKNDDAFFSGYSSRRQDYIEKIFVILSAIVEEEERFFDFEITDRLLETAISEIFGLGILEKYLSDRMITDIFLQDTEMLIIKDGRKQYIGKVFESMEELNLVVERIKISSGKLFDQRVPFLNTDLYDGSRCSIVIPPISDKIYVTIRVFNCIDLNIRDLLELGMFDEKTQELLKNFVAQKRNILISGSTGSGKTTLLNTMAKLIPVDEVINLIQDLPEIKLSAHPFTRMLTTRSKARESDNEINQDRLVFETLRMKADRIILGEVRDCMAAYQLLQALNTGHRGSFSTIHSDSAFDSLLRLETLAMEYMENLNLKIIKKLIARAIDAVIFLENENIDNTGPIKRKIKEIIAVDNDLDMKGDYKLSTLL
jgi:pilus assembly protein CpaF